MNTPSDPLREKLAALSSAFDRCHVSELDPLHLTPEMFHPVLVKPARCRTACSPWRPPGVRSKGGRYIPLRRNRADPGVPLVADARRRVHRHARPGDILRHLVMTAGEAARGLLSKLTLLVLPMLIRTGPRVHAPDAQGLDMNRDALALRTPRPDCSRKSPPISGRGVVQPARPGAEHDRDSRAVTALALLAPAFEATASTTLRATAKKIARSSRGGVVPRPDGSRGTTTATSPRVRDMFQKNGYGTVLLESGTRRGSAKMSIRKANFVVLLAALQRIAEGNFGRLTTDAYDRLPPTANGRTT